LLAALEAVFGLAAVVEQVDLELAQDLLLYQVLLTLLL
jgi:hypothetical protein